MKILLRVVLALVLTGVGVSAIISAVRDFDDVGLTPTAIGILALYGASLHWRIVLRSIPAGREKPRP
ncbi:hypothetical protein ABZZ36_18445 [Actinacidiphila glaucinigra]|uniref:hypothetical protein n=1 Tax=Actinacidiphila glaucinigra TaxID=235986 RepID=UPI0033A8BA90